MKRYVLVILMVIFLVSQNSIYALYQEVETIQTETKQLTDKEEKRLKKQQEKEEKARLKEEKKQQKQQGKEKEILLEEEKYTQEQSENELIEQQEDGKKNINEESYTVNGQIEIDASSHIEKDKDENLIKGREDNPTQNERKGSIQKQEKAIKQESKPSRPLSTKEKTIIWVVVIGIIFLWITRYRYKRKCDGCKKWNAMKKIGTECIDEKPSVITKKREMKNSKGEVVRTWEESIPATIYYYRTHRKCKHCSYRDYLSSSEKREN